MLLAPLRNATRLLVNGYKDMTKLVKIERVARWSAGGLVVLLLAGVLLRDYISPYLAPSLEAGPLPTLILAPGVKAVLDGKTVALAGVDDCHHQDSLFFGTSRNTSADFSCINLGGDKALVVYNAGGLDFRREFLRVVHRNGTVSLWRRNGSPVNVIQ